MTTNLSPETREWSDSQNGRLRICLHHKADNSWSVYALFTGTHDLAPRSKSFTDEAAARAYANSLWGDR